MTTTSTGTYGVRTAHGTVHRMTAGRTYNLRGSHLINRPTSQCGKADCGSLTSSAARLTDEPVNCPKCLGGAR